MVTKIKVNGEVHELTDCCKWEVRNGILFNLNTNKDEGVEGDIADIDRHGTKYRGHVVGYTCYQMIETAEWGKMVLSATDDTVSYTHLTKVEAVDDEQ